MKVGILFRREVNLTYARIQDIHLRSNILQRWLGLANVQIQTASGSSGPELVIEGFKEFEAIRDFLYTRMRGYQTHGDASAHGPEKVAGSAQTSQPAAVTASAETEAITLLQSIRDEMKRTRELLEAKAKVPPPPQSLPSSPQSVPPPLPAPPTHV
jgi:putative membrane protein